MASQRDHRDRESEGQRSRRHGREEGGGYRIAEVGPNLATKCLAHQVLWFLGRGFRTCPVRCLSSARHFISKLVEPEDSAAVYGK